MTNSHELDAALSPSGFSGDGFLGQDSRSFGEIVEEDLAMLRNQDVGKESLADALEFIHCKARDALGAEVACGPGIVAVHHESRGKIPSPLGDGLFEKGETVVTDRTRGTTLVLSALSIHLIRVRGFFQGRGSRYRIEPAVAIEIMARSRQSG